MKKLIAVVVLLFICAVPSKAAPNLEPLPLGSLHTSMALAGQVITPTHQAVLTWTAASDVVSTSSYNVYRTNAVCPVSGLGTLAFTKLNGSAVFALTYTDPTISVGNWCYYITQVQASIESGPSNTAGGQARPNTVTIQIVIN